MGTDILCFTQPTNKTLLQIGEWFGWKNYAFRLYVKRTCWRWGSSRDYQCWSNTICTRFAAVRTQDRYGNWHRKHLFFRPYRQHWLDSTFCNKCNDKQKAGTISKDWARKSIDSSRNRQLREAHIVELEKLQSLRRWKCGIAGSVTIPPNTDSISSVEKASHCKCCCKWHIRRWDVIRFQKAHNGSLGMSKKRT